MASTTQTRNHAGHSHHHHHDNTYLTSMNKKDAGVRITRIGLYVNIAMVLAKGVGGYVFHSHALSADAIHSLTDLVSDIMTLATVTLAIKPPTERFPSGYGKVESLGALGVSGFLLAGGVVMGWSALIDLCRIYAPFIVEYAEQLHLVGHGHSHTHVPNLGAAWIAAASIVVKEWLYRATLKIARERKSSVLESNAVHHRVDSLTAIVAFVSIALGNAFPSFRGFDSLGGLLITWLVVRTGWSNTRTALLELADVGVDEEMKSNVRRAATRALEDLKSAIPAGTIELRNVQGVKAGQNYLMDLELAVPNDWTMDQMRGVEDVVRERVGAKVRGVRRVKIRFVPKEIDQPDVLDEFIGVDVSPTSSPEPEQDGHHHDHDHAHEHNHDHDHANGHNEVRKRL